MKKRLLPSSVRTLLAVAAAAGLLAACGGGGSSAPAGVEVPLGARTVPASAGSDATAAGLSTLGGWLARAVLSASGDGAFDVTRTRESPMTLGAAARSAAPAQVRMAMAFARAAAPATARRERPSAIESESVPCLNADGTMLITSNDADDSLTLSAGDTLTIVATNCVVDAGLPAANGRMHMAINAVELDSAQMPTAMDATITLTQFGVGAYGTFDGAMRLWSKPEGGRERSRLSYQGASVTFPAGTVVFNFDILGLFDLTYGTFELQGGLGIGGQTYALATTTVLASGSTNPPDSGVLSLRDAAGDAVRLTARNANSFDLDFLPAGAGTPTASLPGLLWTDYLQPGR
jgi:hypothetical protein